MYVAGCGFAAVQVEGLARPLLCRHRDNDIILLFEKYEEYEEVIVPVALFVVYNYSTDRCRLCGQGK